MGFKFITGLYASYLGFEFNTYLAGLTHDQDQISAFVSWVNYSNFIFTIGIGVSNVVRTRISNYIGEEKPDCCRNSAKFFVFVSFCVGLVFMVITETFRYSIAGIYTPLPSIRQLIADSLIPYGIALICDILIGCQNTLMRLIGRPMLLTYCMLFFYFFC